MRMSRLMPWSMRKTRLSTMNMKMIVFWLEYVEDLSKLTMKSWATILFHINKKKPPDRIR